MKKKIIVAVSVVLALCCAVGVTLAWLIDTTNEVKNTFTVGDVEITLTETWNTDTDADNVKDAWSAQMIPGTSYAKDPVVTVTDDTNVDCYLFVKFEEKNNASTYLTYTSTLTVANGWTQGDGASIPDNVWYREVAKAASVKTWNLLENNTITVKADAVTKDNVTTAANAELIYTAYAVQKDNIKTAADAWSKLGVN